MALPTSSAGSPNTCRKAPGIIPRTRSPTRRCASWRPRSRVKSSICGCTRSCHTSPRSRPSYVERESQRKIVLGKGGQTIKAIGADARREIANMIEAPVHLFLFVKVRDRWGDDPDRYRGMGLEFPDE